VNFDSCQYKELNNPENLMNDWNVVMSKPTSIEISRRNIQKIVPEKDEHKTNKFKVINVKNKNKHKTRIRKYTRTTKTNHKVKPVKPNKTQSR
jgi:hypothetical protein